MRKYFLRSAMSIAKSFREPKISVSDFYDDDMGLGTVNTFAMPVFYQPNAKCPAIHYGVVGVDMRKQDYEDRDIFSDSLDFEDDMKHWNYRLTECQSASVDKCHMQVLRGEEAQCVYSIRDPKSGECYRFNERIYYVEDDALRSFYDATQFCLDLGGQLIAPQDPKERQFLATLIPPDGSWIDIVMDDDNVTYIWLDGQPVFDEKEGKRIARVCDFPFPSAAFYMDPRNYRDNFQCVQPIRSLATVCQFDSEKIPSICKVSDV